MKLKNLYLAVVAGAAVLLLSVVLVQAQAVSPSGKVGPAPAVTHKTLWERIYEGGWVMIPIAACSILTVYLVGEGVVRTSTSKLSPVESTNAVKNLFRQGDYVGAYNFCKANPSPVTNVVRVGVSYLGDGQNMTETAMSEELAKENSNVQTKLSYLSVIGVCTPMIGLLGTVTGMIKRVRHLGHVSGIGDPSSSLAAAIGEVLVATASGLIIAIPAFASRSTFYATVRPARCTTSRTRSIAGLFRKMPYDLLLAGVHLGDAVNSTPPCAELGPSSRRGPRAWPRGRAGPRAGHRGAARPRAQAPAA